MLLATVMNSRRLTDNLQLEDCPLAIAGRERHCVAQHNPTAGHLHVDPSPRWAAEIKHTCARSDLEIKYEGINNIEAYVSAWLHYQDITFKWPPPKPCVERRVSRFAE